MQQPQSPSGQANRDELVAWVDGYLEAPAWKDFCPNGLQVHGAEIVRTITVSVSSNLAVFERAAELGSDLHIAHHGLFWRGDSQRIGAREKRRLQVLFDNDISLCGWHLPLDAHPTIGNNALLAAGLGVTPDGRYFGVRDGRPLGAIGTLERPCSTDEFLDRVASFTSRTPLHLGASPEVVRSVAICSGGASGMLTEAIEAGVDAYITGEPSEPGMALAAEAGVAFIAAGHYATETFGVRALGELLVARYGVRIEFIDVPTPV